MSRAAARLRHPSQRDGRAFGEVRASALAYRDVVEAYEELEHALEHHEPLAATAAAFNWWALLEELRAS